MAAGKPAVFDPEVAVQMAELAAEAKPIPTPGPAQPRLRLADVALYHKNPRTRKNVDDIVESLRENGQYKPVTVNVGTRTGRANEVLTGNHTVRAMRELALQEPDDNRWHNVLVHMVDVDDARAAKIVAVDNRSADKGKYDDEILAALLADIPDLTGSGYTDDELAKLVGSNVIEGDADTELQPHVWGIVIDCDTEHQQTDLLDRLTEEGFSVRALM